MSDEIKQAHSIFSKLRALLHAGSFHPSYSQALAEVRAFVDNAVAKFEGLLIHDSPEDVGHSVGDEANPSGMGSDRVSDQGQQGSQPDADAAGEPSTGDGAHADQNGGTAVVGVNQ